MELTDIQSFYIVAINKNISKAAKILNISQPALSKRLKEIESGFDKPLLLRSNKGIELTETGVLVYNYCKKIMELTHQLDKEIAIDNNHNSLSLAITSSIIDENFHSIIKGYKDAHQNTEISIQVEPCKKIIRMILNDEIDFGIIQQIGHSKQLNYNHLTNTELVLVTNARNPINSRVSIYDIVNLPIILPFDNSNIIEKLKKALAAFNLHFSDMNIIYQTNSLKIILTGLMEEKIYTILPKNCIIDELDSHKLQIIKPLEKIDLTCAFSLITKKNKVLDSSYQNMVDYLVKAYQKL